MVLSPQEMTQNWKPSEWPLVLGKTRGSAGSGAETRFQTCMSNEVCFGHTSPGAAVISTLFLELEFCRGVLQDYTSQVTWISIRDPQFWLPDHHCLHF